MRIRDLYILRASQIKKAKPGKLSDGGGLILLTKPSGRQYWQFRVKLGGKETLVSLGSADILSLADARDKAATCRQAVVDGRDPKRSLTEEKLDNKSGPSFKDVALDYLEANKGPWSEDHYNQWKQTLRDYVYPHIGDIAIKDLEVEDVYALLLAEGLWYDKHTTATRVRSRIAKVWGAARVLKHCTGSNPASWDDNLENLLPSTKKVRKKDPVKHHVSMPYEEMPAFMVKLQEARHTKRSPLGAKGLIWAILTGCRYQEVTGARFSEIKGNLWTIPAERTKTRREHKVPITPAMMDLLEQLREEQVCDLLFPSVQRKTTGFQPMCENTMTKYLQVNGPDASYTTHGFRTTFKTWALDKTNYLDEVSEMQLNHVKGDEARRAYARTDMLEKRRELMEKYAAYAMGTSLGRNVVKLA